MGDLGVNFAALATAAELWRGQSHAVTAAANAVAGAGASGFDPEVRPAVDAFLSTWSKVTQDMAGNAEATAESLDAGWRGYAMYEADAREQFDRQFGYDS